MDFYQKKFEFALENKSNFEEKLIRYFELYDFKKNKIDNNEFTFYKKWSLFDGWKTNPLNWKSKLIIKQFEDKLIIDYAVDGNGQITPIAFESLFENFITNLIQYLNTNKDFVKSNAQEIAKAQKKIIKFFLFIILGIGLGFIVGYLFEKLTDSKIIGTFTMLASGYLSLKILNNLILEKQTISN
ncbi:hypothetical protein [Polaribacter sp.]|uniref:hypothetical protein n=1 Tax=Polaribacter sp. TaxID=1920175 RepID=UPI003F6BADC2